MMTRDQQIHQLLWPPDRATRGTEIYAVFDGARDRRIHQMVRSSELAWRCLYAGTLPEELLVVAPYLVNMLPGSSFTRDAIASGWGNAWCIWMVSAAVLDDLRLHLRRFLRVQDPAGRRLLFRYYDPVVLGTFLPTCTTAELAALFGPIDAFLVETSRRPELAELRFDGTTLHTCVRTSQPGSTDTP